MEQKETYIIIPSYNEGETIGKLLEELNVVAEKIAEPINIVVVDDGSVDDTIERVKQINFSSARLRIISLLYNIGHQGAIVQGILFAQSQNADRVIVMDGDGEDDPMAIPELLKLKSYDIVNVVRGRRRESLSFRAAYSIYRFIFFLVTKKKMNFGNFCMINERVIEIISKRSFIHLAGFLSKLQLKSTSIHSDRRRRLGGKTKMSMSNLIQHAFRSFAEYSETFLMVFLRFFILLFLFFIFSIAFIVYLKLFTAYPIPGWTSTFGIGLLTSALICIGFFMTSVLNLNYTQRNNSQPVILYKIIR